MYRSFCALALFVVFASATEDERKRELVVKCAQESGIDPNDFKSHRKNGQPDQKMKCFYLCWGINAKSLNADGSFNTKLILDRMPNHMPNKMEFVHDVQDCGKLKGGEKCELAYKVADCCAKRKILQRLRESIET